jgi:hypothetical protein
MFVTTPPATFRSILRQCGRNFFADEARLNLLSRRDLTGLAERAGLRYYSSHAASLSGWTTNLLLCAVR